MKRFAALYRCLDETNKTSRKVECLREYFLAVNPADAADFNVRKLAPYVDNGYSIVGCEPSCLLTFRDEYPDLLRGEEKEAAKKIGYHTLMVEEFLSYLSHPLRECGICLASRLPEPFVLPLLGLEIGIDLVAVSQVVSNGAIHLFQGER